MFYYLRTYNYRQAPSPAVYNKPNWIHLWCIASHPQQSIVCYRRTKFPSTEVFQSETFASSILRNCICLWEAGLMPTSPDVTDEAQWTFEIRSLWHSLYHREALIENLCTVHVFHLVPFGPWGHLCHDTPAVRRCLFQYVGALSKGDMGAEIVISR